MDVVQNATLTQLAVFEAAIENASQVSDNRSQDRPVAIYQSVMVTSYVLICICGLIGNALVIYAILHFSKLKAVTKVYIMNLAISDVLFLISLPFLIATTIFESWIFGRIMCKAYFMLVSINIFTSVFSLTAISADRYLAVCHPVRAVYYRTTKIAIFVCLGVWITSFLVMLPIILYSTTIPSMPNSNKETCTVLWPDNQVIPGYKAFVWYTVLLGFSIPVVLISVFYVSLVVKLWSIGPGTRSSERKKSNRRVTRMVLMMIATYVICWLPYWCFQMSLTFRQATTPVPAWQLNMFIFFTVLSYANSMLNPVVYTFMSDTCKMTFFKLFRCGRCIEANRRYDATNTSTPRRTMKDDMGEGYTKLMLTEARGSLQHVLTIVHKVQRGEDETGQ